MSSPKIKLYLLPPGYSEAGDNDVQTQRGDEILPVADRSQLLSDAVTLTGIVPHYATPLVPVDLSSGRQTAPMIPNHDFVQTPSGYMMDQLLIARGHLGIQIRDHLDQIMVEHLDYSVTNDGIKFLHEGEVGPSGAVASFFLRGESPTTDWALEGNSLYTGDNEAFNRIVIRVDGGQSQEVTTADVNTSYIQTDVPVSGILATYAYAMARSRHFCGNHNNWIDDHLSMRPDIYVGTTDYPGDASEVNGVPYEPGQVPAYRDPGSYQLNARDGLVQFGDIINSTATPVKANYAHLVGIHNVTRMRLDPVNETGNTQYMAISEDAFPNSHGKRWVMQRSRSRPINVYVNGTVVPNTRTVIPYDQLTVKTEE
jgi:hypothetical protein